MAERVTLEEIQSSLDQTLHAASSHSKHRLFSTDGVIDPHEPIGLNAEIRLRNQTHRRETASYSLLSHFCAQKCAQLIEPLQLMQVFSE